MVDTNSVRTLARNDDDSDALPMGKLALAAYLRYSFHSPTYLSHHHLSAVELVAVDDPYNRSECIQCSALRMLNSIRHTPRLLLAIEKIRILFK